MRGIKSIMYNAKDQMNFCHSSHRKDDGGFLFFLFFSSSILSSYLQDVSMVCTQDLRNINCMRIKLNFLAQTLIVFCGTFQLHQFRIIIQAPESSPARRRAS